MEPDLYSRQMKWLEVSKKKAIESKTSKEEDPECTFEPKKFTKNPQKKFSGTALEKGQSNHIVRQAKARQKESPIKTSSSKNSSLLPIEMEREYGDPNAERGGGVPSPASGSPVGHSSGTYGGLDSYKMDGLDFNDETVVDMLERERREWQSDRVKLIHCIHLQQLELTQRALASHDKATDIAKEFARAIEGFEERLVSVENNVHKEISAIKSIAETLLLSSTKTQQKDEAKMLPVEKRVATLENCMEGILDRLDSISASLGTHSKHPPHHS